MLVITIVQVVAVVTVQFVDQPTNVCPAAGLAVSVTVELSENPPVQIWVSPPTDRIPQLIGPGVLVTMPKEGSPNL